MLLDNTVTEWILAIFLFLVVAILGLVVVIVVSLLFVLAVLVVPFYNWMDPPDTPQR